MKLLNKKALREFRDSHPDAHKQLDSWQAEMEAAEWKTPHELKQRYPKASILKGGNVIFDICYNRYRIWVVMTFKHGIALIKKIGTHAEYDRWSIK